MSSVKGIIKKIEETQVISEKFRKREFVVQTLHAQYPQFILFQASQDNCDRLNENHEGQLVEVSYNLRGREWTNPQGETKYFNTLEAWKLTPVEDESGSQESSNDEDGLPF